MDAFDTPPSVGSQTGGSGNDIFSMEAGNDNVDGGNGRDVVVFNGGRANYSVTQSGSGYSVSDTVGTDGTDILTSIERLNFADTKVALDIDGNPNACFDLAGTANAGQVYRLYQAAFDRAPDQGGLSYWIGQADASAPLTTIAGGFTGSVEFQATYGNLTDHQFVDQLYQNVLHRAGDADGLAFWYSQIDSKAFNREQVLVGFAESTENQVALIGVIQNGIDYPA